MKKSDDFCLSEIKISEHYQKLKVSEVLNSQEI